MQFVQYFLWIIESFTIYMWGSCKTHRNKQKVENKTGKKKIEGLISAMFTLLAYSLAEGNKDSD